MPRDVPYSNFNFLVEFSDGGISGGFSDVSGLGTEITVAEYRNGSDRENHVVKIPGMHKNNDVTLKRGIDQLRRPAGAGSTRCAGPAPKPSATS